MGGAWLFHLRGVCVVVVKRSRWGVVFGWRGDVIFGCLVFGVWYFGMGGVCMILFFGGGVCLGGCLGCLGWLSLFFIVV